MDIWRFWLQGLFPTLVCSTKFFFFSGGFPPHNTCGNPWVHPFHPAASIIEARTLEEHSRHDTLQWSFPTKQNCRGAGGSRRINSAHGFFFPSEESWGLRGFDQLCFLGSMCFFQDFWFLVWMISLLCFFRLPLLRNKHKFHGRSAASTSEGFQASLKALKIYSSRKFREEKRLIPAEKGAVFKRCQWILIRCAFFFGRFAFFSQRKIDPGKLEHAKIGDTKDTLRRCARKELQQRQARWWFQRFFRISPRSLGFHDPIFFEHMFKVGWNHQLAI